MKGLATLKEAEQELEIQVLKRRIYELEALSGYCRPVRFEPNPPAVIELAHQPPTLRAVAGLESHITAMGGLEIIAETAEDPKRRRYQATYYIDRNEIPYCGESVHYLADLHARFVMQIAAHKQKHGAA